VVKIEHRKLTVLGWRHDLHYSDRLRRVALISVSWLCFASATHSNSSLDAKRASPSLPLPRENPTPQPWRASTPLPAIIDDRPRTTLPTPCRPFLMADFPRWLRLPVLPAPRDNPRLVFAGRDRFESLRRSRNQAPLIASSPSAPKTSA